MIGLSYKTWVATLGLIVPWVASSTPLTLAGDTSSVPTSSVTAGRMNCGAQIECITPDGHRGRISRLPAQDPTATALILEDDTVTCVLQEGETNFVIQLPEVAVPDRFTFVNENGKARGELKISVSNRRLAPNSSRWKEVEGVIPFVHKRLFGVSLLGIEARYVRLSFHVDSQDVATSNDQRLTDMTGPSRAPIALTDSALNDALNSTAAPQIRTAPVLLSSIIPSVAPLHLSEK